jgi:hypothetical protein
MKPLKFLTALVLVASLMAGDTWAKPGSGSSSKPSSSSRSSSSSKPSSRPSSRPSSSSSKPSSSSFSKPAPTKPSSRPQSIAPSTKPSSRPQSIAPSTKPSSRPVDKVAPVTKPSSRPVTVVDTNSSKPKSTFDSAASKSQKKAESAAAYKAATKPKDSYTTPAGKVVKVDPQSPTVANVRKTVTPTEYANRSTRVENHYHNYYGDRYDTYRSRPYIDVGGGYSPLFWYMMADWSLERRAQWMYNNQNTMNSQLYQQELAKNAQLAAQVEALKARGAAPDPNYIDPEFKDDPDLMYDDAAVTAAFNPTPVPAEHTPSSAGAIFIWILAIVFIGIVLFGLYYFIFRANLFKDEK